MKKGILLKVNSSCWSDDRGKDKFGYVFYIEGEDRGFSVEDKSVNGKFLKDNYSKMLNKEIEFSCDEWGYKVKFSKQTISLYK